jgi:molecular chaperone DnaK
VRYNKDRVTVLASGGDLQLGGLDWNSALEQWSCQAFVNESPADDPRLDRESMQALANDVEQAKRALSVRPRATVTVSHAGRRKSFGIDREYFEILTRPLLHRTRTITEQMLRTHKLQIEGRESASEKHTGWAHVNAVLVTGGATRMPMVRSMLEDISGRTLNATLSPDQSIAHGAAYYAGMLLSGEKLDRSVLNKQTTARLARFKQQSVNARGLGILVRDRESRKRVPHYLIPPNTALPVSARQNFGTVRFNQRRVNLHVIESGANPEDPPVDLGACIIDGLPVELPENTPIDVTIRYDEQARVHVEAKERKSGKAAKTTIVRTENLLTLPREAGAASDVQPLEEPVAPPRQPPPPSLSKNVFRPATAAKSPVRPKPAAEPPAKPPATKSAGRTALEESDRPVPLCNRCGEPFDARGRCTSCGAVMGEAARKLPPRTKIPTVKETPQKGKPGVPLKPGAAPAPRTVLRRKTAEHEAEPTEKMQSLPKSPPRPKMRRPHRTKDADEGADEFWRSLE